MQTLIPDIDLEHKMVSEDVMWRKQLKNIFTSYYIIAPSTPSSTEHPSVLETAEVWGDKSGPNTV